MARLLQTRFLLLGGVILIGFLVIAWYLLSPLFINRTVDEAFPLGLPGAEEMAQMPATDLAALEEAAMATAAAMPDQAMDEAMPGGEQPAVLSGGQFVGADDFHQGSGSATLYQLPDGSRVLRLEEFMVTNGPDLHVILSTAARPTSRDDIGEYIDLGSLKGNIGDQNYEIPADVELSAYQSVVIYCVPFHVLFASATLGEEISS